MKPPAKPPASKSGGSRGSGTVRSLAAAGLLILAGGGALADGGGESANWAVLADSSLRASLQGWAESAGWTLVWEGPFDFRIQVSAEFEGSFEEAVAALVDAVHLSDPGLAVTLYRGNKVVHARSAEFGN